MESTNDQSSSTLQNPKKIVDDLNKMRAEQRALSQKSADLELDANEHRLVINVLKDINPDRTCYRLIGGILIQQTVKDVLPNLEQNFDMLKKTATTYRDNVKTKGQAINEYIQKYNLGPLIRAQAGGGSGVVPMEASSAAAASSSSSSKD